MTTAHITVRIPVSLSQRMVSCTLIALVHMFCLMTGHAQPGTPVWTNRFGGPGNSDDRPSALAVDHLGNVFVTGGSGSGNAVDYVTVAYSNTGIPLWTNRYNGPGYGGTAFDRAQAICVDRDGNIFVTGASVSGSDTYTYRDFATIKYSNSGIPLWTNRYNGLGNGDDEPTAIAVDASGNVFVTGWSVGSGSFDYATVAYANTGDPLWTNRYADAAGSEDRATAIAVESNVVFVAGTCTHSLGYPNWSNSYAMIAYSIAGLPLWTNRWDRPITNSGGVSFLTAHNGKVVTAGSSPGYLTLAYSTNGLLLWTNYGLENGSVNGIVSDNTGSFYVTGSDFVGNVTGYVTMAYSNGGAPLWTNRYRGPIFGFSIPAGLTVDGGGNVFVTGSSGNGPALDYATVAYSSAGVPLWTNLYDSGGTDGAHGVAVDGRGNVFVTGRSGSSSSFDFVTIKYASMIPENSVSPIPLDIQVMGNQLVLTWTNAAFSLQSASSIQGAYTNIPSATSPYTNLISGDRQFFRLKAD